MTITTTTILLVGTGGIIGACARYIISGTMPQKWDLPTGTLLVNPLGTFILSAITFSTTPMTNIHLVNIGILGSSTTF